MKVDLHVHSHASNQMPGFIASKLRIRDCYSDPVAIYRRLKDRGMDLVTFTDPDTIDGCLAIADRPDTFISEAVTTYFPEEVRPDADGVTGDPGLALRVLVFHITAAQHDAIQAIRQDVYALVDYLQTERIAHTLAHPLADASRCLTPEHVEKCLLLFDVWERQNGGCTRLTADLTARLVEDCTPAQLRQLAQQHGFNKRQRETITFTGGSACRSGFDAGSTFTVIEGAGGATTADELAAAIRDGRTRIDGQPGSAVQAAHTVLHNGFQSLREQFGFNSPTLAHLFDGLKNAADPAAHAGCGPDIVSQVVSGQPRVQQDGTAHDVLFAFFGQLARNRLASAVSGGPDIDAICRGVGEALIGSLPALSYVATFRERSVERKHARHLYEAVTGQPLPGARVGYFTDTFFEYNGVARTSQKLHALANDEGLDLQFIVCDSEREDGERLKVVPPIVSLPLPGYPGLTINIPGLLALLEYVERQEFDVIYGPTPGPMGLCSFLIAKILDLPWVTTCHTDFVKYAASYTKDACAAAFTSKAMSWLYNQADRVLAPSDQTARVLRERGVEPGRITVFRRGVDSSMFSPERRDPLFWNRFDPTWHGETVVIYAGRVAVEKGLEVFSEMVEQMRDHQNLKFAVVGDGPLLAELKRRHGRDVIFTGYLEGDELCAAYASADVFVCPSETETFGNVILEAAAAGIPALVADKGASRENVQPGITGWVIEGNTAGGYAAKVARLLEDPDLHDEMRRDARAFACQRDQRRLLLEMIRLFSLGRIAPLRDKVFESDVFLAPVGSDR